MVTGAFPRNCVRCGVPVRECLKPMAYVLQNPGNPEWFGAQNQGGAWLVVNPASAPKSKDGRILHLPIQIDPFWDVDEEVKKGLMCHDCCCEGIAYTNVESDGEIPEFPED